MNNLLLKAKHWHLFTLTFGIPFILQLFTMVRMMTKVFTSENIPSTRMFSDSIFLIVITIAFSAILLFWIWAVAIGLQKKVPETVKLKTNRFKFFFFTPIVYMIIYLTIIFPSFMNSNINPMVFLIILPFHLFVMFCMIYCLYFTAKTFRTVELQREVHSGDYLGEFFLIWFFPIGVWIIQPRINKIVQE
jgi:hypothetical protein